MDSLLNPDPEKIKKQNERDAIKSRVAMVFVIILAISIVVGGLILYHRVTHP